MDMHVVDRVGLSAQSRRMAVVNVAHSAIEQVENACHEAEAVSELCAGLQMDQVSRRRLHAAVLDQAPRAAPNSPPPSFTEFCSPLPTSCDTNSRRDNRRQFGRSSMRIVRNRTQRVRCSVVEPQRRMAEQLGLGF
ncbi:MAG: hypothetical protein FJW22_11940 [Acidimicrobiia bacterium]|nr:hypothetical protein [Acidimicrobiia bacterium]